MSHQMGGLSSHLWCRQRRKTLLPMLEPEGLGPCMCDLLLVHLPRWRSCWGQHPHHHGTTADRCGSCVLSFVCSKAMGAAVSSVCPHMGCVWFSYHACSSPLYSLSKTLIGSIEGTLDKVTIFEVWVNKSSEQQQQSYLVVFDLFIKYKIKCRDEWACNKRK